MARPKDVSDGAMPSGTAAALHLLAALVQRTDELAYEERAKDLVGAAAGQVQRAPTAFSSLLQALSRLRHGDAGPRQYAARGRVRIQAQVVRDGDAATLILDLSMAPGWHVNAHEPLQDYLIPTSLRLTGDTPAWRIDNLIYPRSEILKLGFQREPLAVYQGQVKIEASLTPESERSDRASAWPPVELRLQACSDDRCLPPETRVIQIPAGETL